MTLNDDQIENWRSAMSMLTAYYETDDAERYRLTSQVLTTALDERSLAGVVGMVLGLQSIAALTLNLLAAATNRTPAEARQLVGQAFEDLLRQQGHGG